MMEIIRELLAQKKTLLVTILILMILNAALYAVQHVFLSPRLKSAEQRFDDLRRRAAAEGAADVSTIYKQGVENLKTLTTRIPSKRQFPQLLGDLMEMASSNSLRVGKMTYKPQVIKEDDLLAYSLSMSVNGSYAGIKSFIADLQAKNDLLVIQQTSLSNEDPYEESVVLDLVVTVYLRNKEGV